MAFVTLKDMGSDFHRLELFDGGDFVRWQRKMHFLLVTMRVYYVIVNPRPPEPDENESVMEQFNEIKTILDRYSQHKLALDEFIVVTSIIDKLPPSWKDLRNSLKHRKEDINLDELGTHLRIEEDLCKEEKSKNEGISKILALEEGESSKKNSRSW
ncbi:hypothetical protein RJ639_015779 [Escallonia herrerae]|uniref:Uncharacterized protein n=1 Tax=Escallonia herrerae TaxID=1293975 RepID=A0AA88VBT6_9ASTE|nr:hypothetical protein RJ639_015779 [Escallonia herrerae]